MSAAAPGWLRDPPRRPSGRLVSVGNVVMDITLWVPALPASGSDVFAQSSGMSVGGSFNVLVAAVRQGLPAAYGGAHGTGPFGDAAREALRAAGIEVLLPSVPGQDTGYDIAITEDGGERTFITAAGAEACLSPELADTLTISPRDFVHVSGYGLLHDSNREAILQLLDRLPAATVVLLDPGPLGHDIPASPLERVLHRANWWSGSLAEALRATGCADATSAARQLARFGRAGRRDAASGTSDEVRRAGDASGADDAGFGAVDASGSSDAISRVRVAVSGADADLGVVVRLGLDGCIVLAPGGDPVHVSGFIVDAVDTNGAGDAHVGAFLAGLAAGRDPTDAARRANACAAISTTRFGPATAPTAAEVTAFIIQDSV